MRSSLHNQVMATSLLGGQQLDRTHSAGSNVENRFGRYVNASESRRKVKTLRFVEGLISFCLFFHPESPEPGLSRPGDYRCVCDKLTESDTSLYIYAASDPQPRVPRRPRIREARAQVVGGHHRRREPPLSPAPQGGRGPGGGPRRPGGDGPTDTGRPGCDWQWPALSGPLLASWPKSWPDGDIRVITFKSRFSDRSHKYPRGPGRSAAQVTVSAAIIGACSLESIQIPEHGPARGEQSERKIEQIRHAGRYHPSRCKLSLRVRALFRVLRPGRCAVRPQWRPCTGSGEISIAYIEGIFVYFSGLYDLGGPACPRPGSRGRRWGQLWKRRGRMGEGHSVSQGEGGGGAVQEARYSSCPSTHRPF